MEYTKEGLIKLLIEIYGPLKEGNRTDFLNVTSKEIAIDLGYDESQFSRIINPGIGKEPSTESYQRIITRLQQNLENRNLKEENFELKNRLNNLRSRAKSIRVLFHVASFLLFLSLLYSLVNKFNSKNDSFQVQSCCILSPERMTDLLKWHGTNIQNQFALMGLIFHLEYLNQPLTEEEKHEKLEDLKMDIKIALNEGRSQLVTLPFETGKDENIEEILIEIFDDNEFEKSFADATKSILDENISIDVLIGDIFRAIESAQQDLQTQIRAVLKTQKSCSEIMTSS